MHAATCRCYSVGEKCNECIRFKVSHDNIPYRAVPCHLPIETTKNKSEFVYDARVVLYIQMAAGHLNCRIWKMVDDLTCKCWELSWVRRHVSSRVNFFLEKISICCRYRLVIIIKCFISCWWAQSIWSANEKWRLRRGECCKPTYS